MTGRCRCAPSRGDSCRFRVHERFERLALAPDTSDNLPCLLSSMKPRRPARRRAPVARPADIGFLVERAFNFHQAVTVLPASAASASALTIGESLEVR